MSGFNSEIKSWLKSGLAQKVMFGRLAWTQFMSTFMTQLNKVTHFNAWNHAHIRVIDHVSNKIFGQVWNQIRGELYDQVVDQTNKRIIAEINQSTKG
jgi:hypothetical protein